MWRIRVYCIASATIQALRRRRGSLAWLDALVDRGVYSIAQLQAEALRHSDPAEYQRQVRSRYIRGVNEDRPAVVSVNTQTAATAVNEFLARLHPYRYSSNEDFSTVRLSFIQGEHYHQSDAIRPRSPPRSLGRGDVNPLLGMPQLSEEVR